MNSKKGIIFILLSSFLFASYGVWSRLMGNYFGNFFQGWTRGIIICLILIPILLWKKEIIPIKRRDWKWMAVFLIFTSLTQAPIYYAFNHMDIGTASVLFFVTVLLTMYMFGLVFLKEKITTAKIIAFVMAVIGLFITYSFSLVVFSFLAASLAVLNGIASGGEVASTKKLSQTYSPLYLTFLSWLIIIVTNAPISILLGEIQRLPEFNLPWLFQLCYVFANFFAFWFVVEGLKHVESSIGGLLGLLEVVFSILFGIIIFQETLTLKIIIGAMLVLTAAALPHLVEFRKRA